MCSLSEFNDTYPLYESSKKGASVMQYLICYDIREDKIRTRVMKYLSSFAWHVQYSVFSCDNTEKRMMRVRQKLLSLTSSSESCMILIVPMCSSCQGKIWQIGEPIEHAQQCIVI